MLAFPWWTWHITACSRDNPGVFGTGDVSRHKSFVSRNTGRGHAEIRVEGDDDITTDMLTLFTGSSSPVNLWSLIVDTVHAARLSSNNGLGFEMEMRWMLA